MDRGTRMTSTRRMHEGNLRFLSRISQELQSGSSGSSFVSHCSLTPKFGLKKHSLPPAVRCRAWSILPPSIGDANPMYRPCLTTVRCVAGSAIDRASSSLLTPKRTASPPREFSTSTT
jgi:hypothetical protein